MHTNIAQVDFDSWAVSATVSTVRAYISMCMHNMHTVYTASLASAVILSIYVCTYLSVCVLHFTLCLYARLYVVCALCTIRALGWSVRNDH